MWLRPAAASFTGFRFSSLFNNYLGGKEVVGSDAPAGLVFRPRLRFCNCRLPLNIYSGIRFLY